MDVDELLVRVALISTVAACGARAAAQSVYVDFEGNNGPTSPPSSSYAAAAGVGGHWNAVGQDVSVLLHDIAGQPTSVVLTKSGCQAISPGIPPTDDHMRLLGDLYYGDALCGQDQPDLRISNLAPGTYQLFVYAPGDGAGSNVSFLSPFQAVTVDGGGIPWPAGSVFPGTYVDWFVGVRIVHVTAPGSTLQILLQHPGSDRGVSGMQLVRLDDATPFCSGHLGGCPCGVGQPGAGCPSSFNASGASLSGAGSRQVSNDGLQLTATGVLSSGFCVLFQGTSAPGNGQGVPFGDGLRCAGGPLKRIVQRAAVGGVLQYPAPGDPPVSVRGAVPASGGFRTYQLRYRNAASYCTSDTFNTTNGVAVEWLP